MNIYTDFDGGRGKVIYLFVTNLSFFSLWSLLNIRDKYALALRNKFDALEEKTETHTPNDEYENFVNAH